MKKLIGILGILTVMTLTLVGCNQEKAPSDTKPNDPTPPQTESFGKGKEISVVSREDGSGTRGAFIELFKVQVKSDDGKSKDMTTKEAIIASKTDVMLTNVANGKFAIGYVSMGSLNDSIKALKIDGAEPTTANVKSGTYKIARPFNIATKGEPTGLTKDFIDFIMSKEGQEIVAKSYIAVKEDAQPYAGTKPEGKLVIAGSSSVSPVMEKLKEAYEQINTNAVIEIQMSDSTTGMTWAVEGTCDIGMASRALKDSEKEQLTGLEIAQDGIAVIVNKENTNSDMTSEQVRQIFTGEVTKWDEVK